MARLLAALGIVLSLLVVAPAHAATVVVWRPPRPSPELNEALFRLQGELLAVGLEVRVTERPESGAEAPADVHIAEEAAARAGADAVIAVVADDASLAADIWVFQRTPPTSDVSRVEVERYREDGAKALAIRAIEVLRSRLVELDLASRRPRREAFPERRHREESPSPPFRAERLGLEAGAALLTSLDGVGPAVLPLVRLDYAPSASLVLQATAAGFGSRPEVRGNAGSAEVRQEYGLVGACYCARSGPPLYAFAAASAGFLRTAVTGRASLPSRGHAVSQWSFLVDGSVGASLRLPGRFYLTLASHVQLAEPYVSIHFADAVVASTGRPNLLFSLTAGAWL